MSYMLETLDSIQTTGERWRWEQLKANTVFAETIKDSIAYIIPDLRANCNSLGQVLFEYRDQQLTPILSRQNGGDSLCRHVYPEFHLR